MTVRIRLAVSLVALLMVACGRNDTHRAENPGTVPSDTTGVEETQHPQDAGQVTSSPLSSRVQYNLSYSAREGKNLFLNYCAVCHGTTGKGDGFNAYNLQPHPRDLTDSKYMSALSDARLSETIREGGVGVRKSPDMPAWGNTFTDRQVEELVRYIRALTGDSSAVAQ